MMLYPHKDGSRASPAPAKEAGSLLRGFGSDKGTMKGFTRLLLGTYKGTVRIQGARVSEGL